MTVIGKTVFCIPSIKKINMLQNFRNIQMILLLFLEFFVCIYIFFPIYGSVETSSYIHFSPFPHSFLFLRSVNIQMSLVLVGFIFPSINNLISEYSFVILIFRNIL